MLSLFSLKNKSIFKHIEFLDFCGTTWGTNRTKFAKKESNKYHERVVDNASSKTFHPTTYLLGTPYYMSPEMIQEKGYNHASDIWSLGCVLYEMSALRSPFYGDKMDLLTLCKKIKTCDYPRLSSGNYSVDLRNLVDACISRKPDERPNIDMVHEIAKNMNAAKNAT